MATEPPAEVQWPPDQCQMKHKEETNKTPQESSSNSSYSSSNLHLNEANTVAISEKELCWAHKIISLEKTGLIRVKPGIRDDSPYQDISKDQISDRLILPNERSAMANSQRITSKLPHYCLEISNSSNEIRAKPSNGMESPPPKVPTHKFSIHLDGGNSGGENSSDRTVTPAIFSGEGQHEKGRSEELNMSMHSNHIVNAQNKSNDEGTNSHNDEDGRIKMLHQQEGTHQIQNNSNMEEKVETNANMKINELNSSQMAIPNENTVTLAMSEVNDVQSSPEAQKQSLEQANEIRKAKDDLQAQQMKIAKDKGKEKVEGTNDGNNQADNSAMTGLDDRVPNPRG